MKHVKREDLKLTNMIADVGRINDQSFNQHEKITESKRKELGVEVSVIRI